MHKQLITQTLKLTSKSSNFKNGFIRIASATQQSFSTSATQSNLHSKTFTNNKISYSNTVDSHAHLIPDTVRDIIEKNATERPNDLCYLFPHNKGLRLTFGEVKQRVQVLAQNFLHMGFKSGDRIAFILPNTHELTMAFLAAASIGAISVLLNPGYQLVEIEYMLKKTGAKGFVFYDSFKTLQHYNIIKTICPELEKSEPGQLNSAKLPDLKHLIVLNSPLSPEKKTYKGTWSFDALANKTLVNQQYDLPHVEFDDALCILFTSGTTGFPKGALIKNFGLLNTVGFANHLPLRSDWGKLCIPIPLFHIFGLGFGVFAPLLGGKETILPFYLPDTPATLKAITEFKADSLMGAPTILIDLLNHPDRKTKFNIDSLKNILMGASAIPKDLILKLNAELKLDNVILGYGMTETSLGQSFTRLDDAKKSFKHAFESIGRPLPFTECKIVNPESNKIVPLNTDGELCLRGYNIISGYWDEPKKTAESFDKNGWFKTGDICHMDEHGYLYFKSRCKDLIIRGGVNIYPAEVEAFLRTHPKVIDAAVVGVPDQRFGEEVCAWLKLKPNETMSYDELKQFCTGNIAIFKIPKYMKVVDSFPINANGKMMKNKIVEMAKKDLNL